MTPHFVFNDAIKYVSDTITDKKQGREKLRNLPFKPLQSLCGLWQTKSSYYRKLWFREQTSETKNQNQDLFQAMWYTTAHTHKAGLCYSPKEAGCTYPAASSWVCHHPRECQLRGASSQTHPCCKLPLGVYGHGPSSGARHTLSSACTSLQGPNSSNPDS